MCILQYKEVTFFHLTNLIGIQMLIVEVCMTGPEEGEVFQEGERILVAEEGEIVIIESQGITLFKARNQMELCPLGSEGEVKGQI
jgi:exosome complex RNA-binding protein Rrp42 (RNase PH superfamily)